MDDVLVGAGFKMRLKMRDDAKQAKEGNGQYLVQLSLTKAKEIHFSYLKPYQSKSTYAQYVTLEIKIG